MQEKNTQKVPCFQSHEVGTSLQATNLDNNHSMAGLTARLQELNEPPSEDEGKKKKILASLVNHNAVSVVLPDIAQLISLKPERNLGLLEVLRLAS